MYFLETVRMYFKRQDITIAIGASPSFNRVMVSTNTGTKKTPLNEQWRFLRTTSPKVVRLIKSLYIHVLNLKSTVYFLKYQYTFH